MRFFEWLDRIGFFGIKIWAFSVRSLTRPYAYHFFWRVLLRHPLQSWRGFQRYRRGEGTVCVGDTAPVVNVPLPCADPEKSIVGVGFCLKPLDPPCPSGRFNHDCHFFERKWHRDAGAVPACCTACMIREIGMKALATRRHFYIMTSAQDILFDMLLPALQRHAFRDGVFAICPYSFEPFRSAMVICGMQGRLYPFESGDCRDWATWRLADDGSKDEQTLLHPTHCCSLKQTLCACHEEGMPTDRFFTKKGNLFSP
jgi:hypothetical protein